jgi:hypothetical protein
MPKCSSEKPIRRDFGNEIWCRRCANEDRNSEEELPVASCHKCGLMHLGRYMTEKIEGTYCPPCASEYESNLLKQMQSPTEAVK